MRAAERALNHLLRFDPGTAARLQDLSGSLIAIELIGPDITVYFQCDADHLYMMNASEREPQVILRGTPLALAAVLRQGEEYRLAAATGVEIRGELALAQQLQSIFAELDVDWEEMLSQVTGDVLAHQAGNLARDFSSWLAQSRRTLEMDLAEYFKYEKQIVPRSLEIERFNDEVVQLRDQVERLEQRIKRAARTLGPARG